VGECCGENRCADGTKGDVAVEAAAEGGIHRIHAVGAGDEDAGELLDLLEEFGDLRVFPGVPGDGAVVEEGVGLVDDEDGVRLSGGAKCGGDLLFRLSNVLGQEVRRAFQETVGRRRTSWARAPEAIWSM